MSFVYVLPVLVHTAMHLFSAPKYSDSFDAEISKLDGHKRWVLGGSALRVWEDDLRSRVQELIRENEGFIYHGHGLREATTVHCWMIGRDRRSAKPTVVIAHCVDHILKETMKVINRHNILNMKGFGIKGCPSCGLQLLTDASSAQLTQNVDDASISFPLSLCGAEVAVANPARYATLGGILTVAEELYAITVAHVFTEKVQVQTQNAVSDSDLVLYDMDWANSSSKHDSSERDRSHKEDAANVGVSRSKTLGMGMLRGLPPLDHSNHEHAIQMGEFPLSRLSSESPFQKINGNRYDGMDWALLNVPRPWNQCVNGVSRNDGSWLHFEKIREDGPTGPVLIITRKGTVTGVGAGTASSIRLQGSSTYRNVWSVQSDHPLDTGDSGAWVVDATTGDLYGVVVAASTVMQEVYLIPGSEIIKDIRRATGVSTVELPKRVSFRQSLRNNEDVDGLFTAKDAMKYRKSLKVTYDWPERTDHEPRQPNATQSSYLNVRQEVSHLGDTSASHSQISETVLGNKHLDTPTSMNNLAGVLSSQGRYEEAEKMYRQALASMETVLGKEHPQTLTSMNELAWVLSSQGRYEEAAKMYRQALASMEKVLGKWHRDTLTSMKNLAGVLSKQGRFQEAEYIYREALARMEPVLGKEHPDTLASVHGLACVLHQTQRYKDAAMLYHRAYTGYTKTLGEKHPTTAECLKQFRLMLEEDQRLQNLEAH